MMAIEDFKKELFAKLLAARIIEHERLFFIPKDLFSGTIADIRVYMDSEMQNLVTIPPYRVSYVSCESSVDQLAFIDITPDLKEENGIITQTFYYYDCDNHKVSCFINLVKPHKC